MNRKQINFILIFTIVSIVAVVSWKLYNKQEKNIQEASTQEGKLTKKDEEKLLSQLRSENVELPATGSRVALEKAVAEHGLTVKKFELRPDGTYDIKIGGSEKPISTEYLYSKEEWDKHEKTIMNVMNGGEIEITSKDQEEIKKWNDAHHKEKI